MKLWRKSLLALVGLIVVAGLSISFLVNANTFRPAIEKQLTTVLGRNVKLGDLSLSLFSGSIVARDVIIADDPNFSAAPFLTAKQLRIGVLMRPLIYHRQVVVRSFQVDSPQITLIRAVDGTWNFSSIGRVASSANGSAAGTTSKILNGSAPNLSNLSVSSIVIANGRVQIESLPTRGRPSVYDHVSLTARNFSFASQFPLGMSANLPAGGTIGIIGQVGPINRDDAAASPADLQISVKNLDPVAAGFLDPGAGLSFVANIDVHAASDGQTVATTGTFRVRNLKLRKGAAAAQKPLDFAYSGTHRLKENSGRIDDAIVKIGNAELHAKGTYEAVPDASNPLLNLKVYGQNLPVDGLRPLMTAAAVRLPNNSTLNGGTLGLNLAISGRVSSLVISGPIALDNTRMVGFDVGSKIHGIAAMGRPKTGDITDIQKLRVNVRLTNAGVVADHIDAVISAVGELTGSGTVSPANQLDFNLIAKIDSAKGIGKVGVKLLTKLNGKGGDSGNASGVPLRVTGTPDEPYITADVGGIVKKKKHSLASIFGKKN
jgi:AsmA protein